MSNLNCDLQILSEMESCMVNLKYMHRTQRIGNIVQQMIATWQGINFYCLRIYYKFNHISFSCDIDILCDILLKLYNLNYMTNNAVHFGKIVVRAAGCQDQ